MPLDSQPPETRQLFTALPPLAFDDVLLLALEICDVDVAVISLIEGDRCWFRSRTGSIDATHAQRISKLDWCPPGTDLLVVSNAFEDARFAQHPLVKGEPSIHFYAAVPLETMEGYACGMLSVVDPSPHLLSDRRQAALKALARHVSSQLELRRQFAERDRLLEDLNEALRKIQILAGLLPICSSCKKIRDDKGYWDDVDHYIQSHSEATFTHGVCPKCLQQLYPDYFKPERSSS
jgi:GAF domain-containing protein